MFNLGIKVETKCISFWSIGLSYQHSTRLCGKLIKIWNNLNRPIKPFGKIPRSEN